MLSRGRTPVRRMRCRGRSVPASLQAARRGENPFSLDGREIEAGAVLFAEPPGVHARQPRRRYCCRRPAGFRRLTIGRAALRQPLTDQALMSAARPAGKPTITVPAASDRSAPMRSVRRLELRQHRLPDAEIAGVEVSWRFPRAVRWRLDDRVVNADARRQPRDAHCHYRDFGTSPWQAGPAGECSSTEGKSSRPSSRREPC